MQSPKRIDQSNQCGSTSSGMHNLDAWISGHKILDDRLDFVVVEGRELCRARKQAGRQKLYAWLRQSHTMAGSKSVPAAFTADAIETLMINHGWQDWSWFPARNQDSIASWPTPWPTMGHKSASSTYTHMSYSTVEDSDIFPFFIRKLPIFH